MLLYLTSMSHHKITNPDQFRAKIRTKINVFFNNEKYATNLEKGIHNWAIKESVFRKVVKKWDNPFFVQLYLDHLRTVYVNIKKWGLVDRVLSGELLPQDIPFMTHQEIRPDKWTEMIRQKSIRDKAKFENRMEATTDVFKCRKCFSKKCTYYALQLRSSDEPMTLFITCIDCGSRWKQ